VKSIASAEVFPESVSVQVGVISQTLMVKSDFDMSSLASLLKTGE